MTYSLSPRPLVAALASCLALSAACSQPKSAAGNANLSTTNSNMAQSEAEQKAKEIVDRLLPLIEGEAAGPGPGELARRLISEQGDEGALRENIRAADGSITYAHLKKNADRYAGRPWAFTGKILEISEVGGGTAARVSLDDWGTKPVWVVSAFETDFLEHDRVYVVGYLGGSYTYTSQAGWTITIPALMARAMLKPGEAAKLKSKK